MGISVSESTKTNLIIQEKFRYAIIPPNSTAPNQID
jgi:hypothetical protein